VTDSGEVDTDEPSWVVPPIGGQDELSDRTKEFRKRNSKEMRTKRKKRLKAAIKELDRRTKADELAARALEATSGEESSLDAAPSKD